MAGFFHKKKRLTSFQIIILGFAALIFAGALFLMLPCSSRDAVVTPFHEALFTAVSAACVTGLVVQDTAAYWSSFGQAVILLLIQIGGLGVVTVAVSFALLSGRKISLMQRSTMQEAIAAPAVGGIVRLTGFIFRTSFLFEAIGAAVMVPVFCRDYGVKGLWMAVFHSISAFCNAGFDIMGTPEERYSSLTAYRSSPVINLTVLFLIIVGGIGFLTWKDIRTNRFHFRRYRMQTKVILLTTVLLILLPALYFFFFEFQKEAASERLLFSLFQAVTPRTAGFNTVDLTMMGSASQTIIIVLMLIGGSPGSTAGGMKTTTIAVLFANLRAVFSRSEDAHCFGRRLDPDIIKNAATILMLYISLFLTGGLLISMIEGLPMSVCLFETASAVGTVGLSLGITPDLGIVSRMILVMLMFLGRVGGLTLIYAAHTRGNICLSRYPLEKVSVG